MIGREFKSEKFTYKDEKTGVEVCQLTKGNISHDYHLYFTDNSFSLGDKEIYFVSDRGNEAKGIFNYFKMDLISGLITQITDEEQTIVPNAHTKTPDSEILVYIIGNKVKMLNTKTMKTDVVYEEKRNIILGMPFISHDKKYIGLPRNENPGITYGANYAGFKERMYGIKKSWITLISLDGSEAVDIYEDTHWVGHFQFAPDDSTIATFCHEGPWNLVHQRIWLLDTVSRSVKPCFRQGEDDCVGHEFWTRDGLIFFDNRRKGHDGTITSDKTQATIAAVETDQVPYIGLTDKSGEVISTIEMPYYCNHYHANNDNSLLVGDEVEDLVLITLNEGKTSLKTLCTHKTSWYGQMTHAHPTFNWNSDKILYTSDRDGKCNIYMVDVPQEYLK